MTNPNRDILEDVTDRMRELRLDSPSNSGSMNSEQPMLAKKTRITQSSGSFNLTGRGGLFDPLLYLRANQSDVSIPRVNLSTSENSCVHNQSSLEEILKNSKSGLLVEPVQRVPKKVRNFEHQKDERPRSTGPKLPVGVYRFCQSNKVEYTSMKVLRTFRSITFSRSRSNCDTSDAWEQYMDLNSFSEYRLCHGLYFGFSKPGVSEESRVVVIVPHVSKSKGQTDVEKIQSSLGASSVRRISLTHMEKELGFPTFVCPPFGHEYAPNIHKSSSDSMKFSTMIDSSLMKSSSSPDCVFDLGVAAIRIRGSELARLAMDLEWTIIENLVRCEKIS